MIVVGTLICFLWWCDAAAAVDVFGFELGMLEGCSLVLLLLPENKKAGWHIVNVGMRKKKV